MLIKHKEYLRSVLFGLEDSLISTTGFIAGMSIGSSNSRIVLLSGLIAITIEGISMAVGEYLSDDTMEELDKLKRHREKPLFSASLLLISYILAGMIPFLPVIIFPFPLSVIVSIALALLTLFLIGFLKGKVLKTSPLKGGFKILAVGGITTIFGVCMGLLFRI